MFKQFLSSKSNNLFECNVPKIEEPKLPGITKGEKSITKLVPEQSLEVVDFAKKILIQTNDTIPGQQLSLTKGENSSTNICTAMISGTRLMKEEPVKFSRLKLFLRHRCKAKCKFCQGTEPLDLVIQIRLELQI